MKKLFYFDFFFFFKYICKRCFLDKTQFFFPFLKTKLILKLSKYIKWRINPTLKIFSKSKWPSFSDTTVYHSTDFKSSSNFFITISILYFRNKDVLTIEQAFEKGLFDSELIPKCNFGKRNFKFPYLFLFSNLFQVI